MKEPFGTLIVAGALISIFSSTTPAAIVQPVSRMDPARQLPGGSGDSGAPVMTPDARFVLFSSTAHNLALPPSGVATPPPYPAIFNVFLRDRSDGTTRLASVNLTGTSGGNGDSLALGISTDGRYALFESRASNLVANDTNNATDVFLRDMLNEVTLLVSANTNGGAGNGDSRTAVMTPDGRFIAFVSAASNLAAGDTNGIPDIFVRDVQSGATVLASPGAIAAANFTSSSESPEISEDGRYVAFYSTATNLVPEVSTTGDLYVRDLLGGITLHASADARAALFDVVGTTNGLAYNHALSADGKFLAYTVSPVTNRFIGLILRYSIDTGVTDVVHTNALMFAGPPHDARTLDITPDGRFIAFIANTPLETNTVPAVLVWDAQSGTSAVATRNVTNGIASGWFEWPTLDPTGRYVCFTASADDLTTNAVAPGAHVYVRDLLLNETVLVDADLNDAGFQVASQAIPRLSADGHSIAFQGESALDNPQGNQQVFVRDLGTNLSELISVRDPAIASATANGASYAVPSVNRDGRFVAFTSFASNLTTNDHNVNRDVIVRDLREQTTVLASVATNGFSGNGFSSEPFLSQNGRFVAFTSTANDLVPLDNNDRRDVFVYDLQTRTMTLGSVATNGGSGNNSSFAPVISEHGDYLFFRSTATTLAPGPFTSGSENLFWRNLQTGTTVALTTTGGTNSAISRDGRYAGYRPVNSSFLYIWDSVAAARIHTNAPFSGNLLAISPDGNRVAYMSGSTLNLLQRSPATNWSVGALPFARGAVRFSGNSEYLTYASSTAQALTDTNNTFDVYLYHIPSRTKTLVSQAHDSPQGANGASDFPDISHDGRFVAYRSAASDIVAGDTNGVPDAFVYDRLTGSNQLLSVAESGSAGNARSFAPVFSGDGRTLVFPSWATDLALADLNQSGDLFAFIFLYATITRDEGQPPVISWPATPGQNYQVQFKTQVEELTWQTLEGNIVITDGTASMQDTSAGAEQRIYRVVGF